MTMNKRMFRILLAVMFSTAALGQNGCGPASGGSTGAGIACSPTPSLAPSPTCCDYTLLTCQTAVRNCASTPGVPTANCAALICPSTSAIPSRSVIPSRQLTNPPSSVMPSASPYPARSANPSPSSAGSMSAYPSRSSYPSPSSNPSLSAYPSRSMYPSPSESATVKQNYPSFTSTATSTTTVTNSNKQADPSTSSTPRQADVSASATNKQADPSATTTSRQADVSASATNKQADPSATTTSRQADVSASATNKQADPSATSTPRQADVSASATNTYKQTEPSATPRPKPSTYPRQTFTLLFQNSNNTLIRSSQKLVQLQTAIACVVQTPLENVDITTIATGSTNLPFTKPQGTGTPDCIAPVRVLYRQRRLQAAATDTTVSVDVLNAPYVSQTSLQTDPMLLSFGSSVGSSGQVVAGPAPAPAAGSTTSSSAIVGAILGVACVGGIVGLSVMYIRSQRARRPVSRSGSITKTRVSVNPLFPAITSSNNKISYSPTVVKMSRSNSV